MRRTVFFILFLGFFANLFAVDFTFNLSERNISVQNDNGIAKFDWSNAVSVDVPGDPALPVYVVDFILPDDADMDSVSVDIINDSADVLTGNFDVLPTAPIEPENSERYWPEHPENIDENGRNRLIYGGNGINAYNGFLHNNWKEKIVKNKWKSVKFVKVFVRAYDWNPATQKLKKLIGGTLRVSVASSDNTITLSHFSEATARSLGNLMQKTVNPNSIRIKNLQGNAGNHQLLFSYIQGGINFDSLVPIVPKPTTLYIITTKKIRDDSKMLEHFIASKNNRGFSVSVVTQRQTETYYNGKTIKSEGWQDLNVPQRADQIRNYLRQNKRYEKIDYLLLIGNPHPGTCNEAQETTGLSNDVIAELTVNNLTSLSREKNCLYNGVSEGDIPMKWINFDAHSNWSGYCRNNNGSPCESDEQFLAGDLRRAYPSDIYYSALSQEWDSNHNGLIGDGSREIGIISNDVILGRIPVYNNNINELDKYFQKVIRYENTLKDYIPNAPIDVDTIEMLRHKIFAPMDYMDNHIDRDETPNWGFAKDLSELRTNQNQSFDFDFMLRGDKLSNWHYPIGYEGCKNNPEECEQNDDEDEDEDDEEIPDSDCTQLPEFKVLVTADNGNGRCIVDKSYNNYFPSEFDDFNDSGLRWNSAEITNRWVDGRYGMVVWSSHGGRDGAVITNNNIATLQDYYPVHTFQASCQTGWPEDPNNLATSLLRRGAVTTIAASRNAWGYSTKFENGVFQLVSEDSRQRSSQELALLHLNRFLLNETAGFSFTRALEELSKENEFKHNEIVFNLYGDPTLGITTWRASERDSDNDGIIDEFDNCPKQYNPKQEDDDLDFVGNDCDNCPNYNAKEINNSEIVVAKCENYVDGEGHNGGARCLEDTKDFVYKDKNGNWWWQPDHNLNGIGDICDIEDGAIENSEFVEWSEFPTVPAGNSKVEFVDQNSQEEHGYIRKNETLAVTIDMKSTNPTKKDEIATTRYCWLSERKRNLWGTDGYCTTEEKHNPDYDNCNDTNFGYSHGTEPVPVNEFGEENWKFIKQKNNQRESDEFTTITTNEGKTINWDWRYDLRTDDYSFENALTTAPICENVSLGVCMDENVPKFYYTMSTGVYSGDPNEEYVKNNEINSAFFKNNKKYTRSSRLLLEPVIISYHKEFFMTVFPPKYCHGAPCNFPMEWLHDMIIDRLIHGPRPYEMPTMEHYFKNVYGSDLINTGVAFREWNNNALGMPSVVEKSRPLLLLTITKNASGMNEGILAVQNNTIFSLRNIQEAVSSNFTFEIVTMDANSNGDWRTKGVLDVSNIPNFMPITSTYHNRDLYVVSKNGGNTAHIYRIDKTDQTITPQQFINICPLRWIFEPIDLGTIINLSNITLHSVGNSLFALGKSGNVMKIFKLSELNGNPYFEDISGTILPEGRDVYNVEIQDDVLYLAGGAGFGENSADLKTDIWSFTETDGWQLIRNDINMFPVTLRIDFDGDNIILTDRVIRPNGTTNRAIFAADGTGDIVIETVPVEGANVQGFGDYCLKESETALQGGIETSGECVPFTHPWYSSFSAGATVYSLAGKGNRLYVGTNNAIKVYDISDPTSPVLVSSFSTSSRVNDLEVYGDSIFAATNGGLYKLDASNDTLTQTLFVSAFLNSQYKAEVYNGKLYVGEDNGIKVRDLDTMSVLTSVNNGSVLDFAIENGEIGLYKDALFSPVEIRDAETLTLKADEFFGCFEIEVGSSDGRFYLSCDDETYRFEDDGDGGISFTELSGDIRELQDVYTFDGYTYFYDENTIWISTSNDVPAICGNGIVEGDEVCDGGQIDCEELDSNYVSGTATCNATCDGYNTNNCSDDGW